VNLLAALSVHSGEVSAMTAQDAQPVGLHRLPRPARSRYPRRPAIIAVRDNLSTRKTEAVERWLDERPPSAVPSSGRRGRSRPLGGSDQPTFEEDHHRPPLGTEGGLSVQFMRCPPWDWVASTPSLQGGPDEQLPQELHL